MVLQHIKQGMSVIRKLFLMLQKKKKKTPALAVVVLK